MSHGKGIRIFLADGNVTGVRHAEIVNWTGQAISCPRVSVKKLTEWSESQRPGVYFLFGVDDESGKDAVYIGEAESVLERLSNHLSGKDFWNLVIFFTSKDENLTKAHVKYLEARLISLATSANRYKLENTQTSTAPSLPRADMAAMEEFLESVRILLGVLGYRLLEPLAQRMTTSRTSDDAGDTANTQNSLSDTQQPAGDVFSFQTRGLKASAVMTDEGLVVLKGSEAFLTIRDSLSDGYRKIRETLIKNHILIEEDDKYRFQSDQLFSSPSQGAAIIAGYPINGREAWKNSEGTSIKELEEQAAAETEPDN